jgi:hypothetical protein
VGLTEYKSNVIIHMVVRWLPRNVIFGDQNMGHWVAWEFGPERIRVRDIFTRGRDRFQLPTSDLRPDFSEVESSIKETLRSAMGSQLASFKDASTGECVWEKVTTSPTVSFSIIVLVPVIDNGPCQKTTIHDGMFVSRFTRRYV